MFMYYHRLDKLDKSKVYAGFSISATLISGRIQQHAWHYIKKNKINIDIEKHEIATHSYLLSYEDNIWWIYESRFRGGVQKRIAHNALSLYDTNIVYEINSFNRIVAESYLGRKYSIRGITRHIVDKAISFIKDEYMHIPFLFGEPSGMFCTEYLDEITGNILARKYNLLSHQLIPFHQQLYIKELGLNNIEI